MDVDKRALGRPGTTMCDQGQQTFTPKNCLLTQVRRQDLVIAEVLSFGDITHFAWVWTQKKKARGQGPVTSNQRQGTKNQVRGNKDKGPGTSTRDQDQEQPIRN